MLKNLQIENPLRRTSAHKADPKSVPQRVFSLEL